MRFKKALYIAVAGTIILTSGCGTSDAEPREAVLSSLGVKDSEIITSDKEDINDTSYILETNYRGADMPIELYDVPFQKSDYYITNKEFEDVLNKKMHNVQSYIDSATDFTGLIFGNNYNTILEDQDTFLEALEGYLGEDSYVLDSDTEDFINQLLEAYVDNKLEVTADFKTDDSLVYNDILYYVRGVVEITVRNGNASDYESLTEIMTKKNETVKYMVEYGFEPDNPSKVVTINKIGYIN